MFQSLSSSVLLLTLLHLNHVVSVHFQKYNTQALDWALVKPVSPDTITSVGDCEFHCFLDAHCEHWTFLNSNQSCFLTSKYVQISSPPSPPKAHDTASSALSSSLSLQSDVIQGNKKEYRKHVNRLVHGPLATSKSSYVRFPRAFYEGCSYTISMWVWMYETQSVIDKRFNKPKELAIFSTRSSLPVFSDYEPLLPAVVFNLGSHKEKMFFSSGKDSFLEYVGCWGDDVAYNEWTHITIVYRPTSLSPYINGKPVRKAVSMHPKNICPYREMIDMTARTAEEKEDILEDFAYVNSTDSRFQDLPSNTILDLGGSKAASPLYGVYEEMDIFSGKELTSHQVQLLFESSVSRVQKSLPTLVKLVSNFQSRMGGYKLKTADMLHNEYAMIALYGHLPAGRVYGGVVCVEGVDADVDLIDNKKNELENDDALDKNASLSLFSPSSEHSQIQLLESMFGGTSHPTVPISNDVFVVNFSLGSKTFPYSYVPGVDSLINAATFCDNFWNELTEAFEDTKMTGIDKKKCAEIVQEISAPQVEHALSFGKSQHQQKQVSQSIGIDGLSSATTIAEGIPSVNGLLNRKSGVETREVIFDDMGQHISTEDTVVSRKIDVHLAVIEDLLQSGADRGRGESLARVSEVNWADRVEEQMQAIEELIAQSEKEWEGQVVR